MPKLDKISSDEKKPLRIGAILILMAIALVIFVVKVDSVVAAIYAVLSALKPLVYGVALAFLLNVLVTFFDGVVFKPLDKRMKSSKWPIVKRAISVVLSLLVILALLAAIIFIVIPELAKSVQGIGDIVVTRGPVLYNSVRKWLESQDWLGDFNQYINQLFLKFNWESLISNASKFTSDVISSLVNATVNITSAIFTAVLSLIFSLYFIMGKEKLLRNLKSVVFSIFPKNISKKIIGVSSLTNQIFYQFVKGQLLECIILGCLCYMGMTIFKFDYALLISSIITITALIPIFGAYIGAATGAFILLLIDPLRALWFIIFIVVLQQLEGNIIYPRVVGSSIGLPAVWTMFAVMFWGALFGIPGILIGTPFTAVIYKLLKRSTREKLKEKGISPAEIENSTIETRSD